MQQNIEINNIVHKVNFKKSKQAKYLRLKIYGNGEIYLIVPLSYTYRQAEVFLGGQIKWIEKKISKLAFNRDKFRYLGYKTKLSIITDKKDKSFVVSYNADSVILPVVDGLTTEQLFENWIFEEAKKYIPSRVKELAKHYGFNFDKVKVKKIKSRWGSCSSKKNLNFNYKLMHFNTKIIDYVIIHELCHLKEMNHSKKFWKLVEQIVPEYKDNKRELSFNHQPLREV